MAKRVQYFQHHSEILDKNTCLYSGYLKTFKKCHGGLWTDVVRGIYKGEMPENIVDGNASPFQQKGRYKKNAHIPLFSENDLPPFFVPPLKLEFIFYIYPTPNHISPVISLCILMFRFP